MLFAVIALVFLWQSAGLNVGTASRMGPAYLPRILCGLMLAVAAVLFVRSFLLKSDEKVSLSLRPMLVVPAAIVIFALALRPLGLVAAIWLTVAMASLSAPGTRPLEVVLVALFLSVFSVAAFVNGLKLNLSVWPGF
jgi:hypothetical protein